MKGHKSPAQLDREIAEVRASKSHATKKSRRESPSAWASTAAGIVAQRVRASRAYQQGRKEVVYEAIAAIGPSPSPNRLRALGGLSKIIADQVANVTTPGLDENLGSPPIPAHTQI